MTKDWVITIPAHVLWKTKEAEYKQAEQDSSITLNYKIPYMPECKPGDRLFVVWRKFVRGFHYIKDVVHDEKGFRCTTTKKYWPPGYYIQRHGAFHKIKPFKMMGFRGIKPFPQYSDKNINMSSDIILSQVHRIDGGNLMDTKDETIVVDEHDKDAQEGEGKKTEQNDSQTFDGITVIPWKDVGQFMGGKDGLTIVSPHAMDKFPSSAQSSIQPGMTAEDGLFDLKELEGILTSAKDFEKTLTEKDAKIVELEKQLKELSENAGPRSEAERAMSHFKISKEDWDAMSKEEQDEKIANLPERGSADPDAKKSEEAEKTDEEKAAEKKAEAEKKDESDSAEAKSVEAEKKSDKEESEHSDDGINENIAKITLGLKHQKDHGQLG